MGAAWAEDGRIYLGSRSGARGGIRSVPAEGGELKEVTRIDRSRESGHRLPWALPGGRALLFTAMANEYGLLARIEAVSLASGERKVVVEDAADPRYLPTGHLLFIRQGIAMAAPFDLERLELRAAPMPVIAGVQQALNMGGSVANSGAGQLAVSPSGLLAYVPGSTYIDAPAEFVLVSARSVEPLADFDRPLCTGWHRFSPDGRQLAFVERAKNGLVWLFDVERRTYRPLTRDGLAGSIVWSPDSSRLVTGWAKDGPFNLWVVPADGEGAWERLTTAEESDWPSAWSPDGRVLAFVRGLEIFLYRFDDRQVVPFITRRPEGKRTSFGYAAFSPDGRWLAYVSDETGMHEVYVTSFPDRAQTFVVSRDGGLAPAWSRDGQRLYYVSNERNQVMAVSVGGGARLRLGLPSAVAPVPERAVGLMPVGRVEMHPDGRRILFARIRARAPIAPVTRLELVQNWFTELERLSPTGRPATRR